MLHATALIATYVLPVTVICADPCPVKIHTVDERDVVKAERSLLSPTSHNHKPDQTHIDSKQHSPSITRSFEMRVAELLSDFNSLRPGVCVCLCPSHNAFEHELIISQDQKAALELVSATSGTERKTDKEVESLQGTEVKRVKELLELHASIKQSHTDGVDAELKNARDAVHRVLQGL